MAAVLRSKNCLPNHQETPRPVMVNDPANEIVEERRKGEDGQVVLHRYLKGKLLGKGGFAKCYLGTAVPSKEQYALKIVLKSTLSKPKAKQKLQSEIRIHRSLNHTGVVRFERFFEDRHNAFMLLELCKNNSMSELMKRRKKVTEPEARFYISQLTGALGYLHDHNIIHRDLKLGNIFLDAHMRVKVGDFGLAARLSHAGERRMTLCGTPNYIAPEILQRKHGHSFEVDIWSTGIIVYTLLCGRPPYESKDVDSTYKRILHNQYSFPDHADVSDAAKSLIQSVLQLQPEKRLTLQQIEAHPFFTRPDVYTPAALTSAAMREVPPSCLPPPPTCSEGKLLKSGSLQQHAPSDENDPGLLNRIMLNQPPQQKGFSAQQQQRHGAHGLPLRDSSPPRKMAHVHPQGQGQSSKSAPSSSRSTVGGAHVSSEERRGKQQRGGSSGLTTRTSSSRHSQHTEHTHTNPPPPPIGLASGPSGGSCFSERFGPSSSSNIAGTSSVPSRQQETSERRGYARQFDVYKDAKQHQHQQTRGIPVDSHQQRSSHFEKPHKHSNTDTVKQENMYVHSEMNNVDTYKFESVETFGGEANMEVDEEEEDQEGGGDEEVALLQRSLEQCGLVQSHGLGQEEQQQQLPPPPPLAAKSSSQPQLTTPAASAGKRGGGGKIDTLECMYETLERSLVCSDKIKIDFTDPEDCCVDQKNFEAQLTQAGGAGAQGGLQAPQVWVVKHVDYTSKYGLGFLMNTGSAGVYFNDSTKIVLSANGSVFQYIERRRRSNGAVEHLCQTHTLDSFPADLNKKVTLLKHFKNYLVDQQNQNQHEHQQTNEGQDGQALPSERALQLMRDMDDGLEGAAAAGGGGVELPYVKKWVRTRHAILFRLSNKTVQVVFFDQSEVLLAAEARVVCFVSKEGRRSEHTLDEVFRSGRSDIAKRLKYTKDIMSRLINLQQPKDR